MSYIDILASTIPMITINLGTWGALFVISFILGIWASVVSAILDMDSRERWALMNECWADQDMILAWNADVERVQRMHRARFVCGQLLRQHRARKSEKAMELTRQAVQRFTQQVEEQKVWDKPLNIEVVCDSTDMPLNREERASVAAISTAIPVVENLSVMGMFLTGCDEPVVAHRWYRPTNQMVICA